MAGWISKPAEPTKQLIIKKLSVALGVAHRQIVHEIISLWMVDFYRRRLWHSCYIFHNVKQPPSLLSIAFQHLPNPADLCLVSHLWLVEDAPENHSVTYLRSLLRKLNAALSQPTFQRNSNLFKTFQNSAVTLTELAHIARITSSVTGKPRIELLRNSSKPSDDFELFREREYGSPAQQLSLTPAGFILIRHSRLFRILSNPQKSPPFTTSMPTSSDHNWVRNQRTISR